MFVHIVNFWLKNTLTENEISFFEKEVLLLSTVEKIINFHVGVPAKTNRSVIDRSYSYCLLLTFKDEAGHDFYQIAPKHLEFIKNCAHLWEKVVIYDSETI